MSQSVKFTAEKIRPKFCQSSRETPGDNVKLRTGTEHRTEADNLNPSSGVVWCVVT